MDGEIQIAQVVENEPPQWSASTLGSVPQQRGLSQQFRADLGEERKRRAAGEHSSIASFAAFTIELMSNQAPLDLIRDSLLAAQDELRHALVSFELASLLTGQTLEPGPLPSSELNFSNNLTTLALAVAQEGCIDETLSALTLAHSVDGTTAVDLRDGDLLSLLAEKTSRIPKEEANHAILAWPGAQFIGCAPLTQMRHVSSSNSMC
jgi:hypothetical protein